MYCVRVMGLDYQRPVFYMAKLKCLNHGRRNFCKKQQIQSALFCTRRLPATHLPSCRRNPDCGETSHPPTSRSLRANARTGRWGALCADRMEEVKLRRHRLHAFMLEDKDWVSARISRKKRRSSRPRAVVKACLPSTPRSRTQDCACGPGHAPKRSVRHPCP